MKQYLDLCKKILNEGTLIENKRTGKRCLTLINADLEYDVSEGYVPVLTTKKLAWRSAIAELLGYLKGFQYASSFRALGCNTWNANANDNKEWLRNPFRTSEDDMGRCYGVQGRGWMNPEGKSIDQLSKIYLNLKSGIDDRGEIMTFWNPGEIDRACLRSCMHTHTFSLVGRKLYLTSYQRSCDVPLGLGFNMFQCAVFLLLMARITGNVPAKVFHKIVNAHIYEDQLEPLKGQLLREPFDPPKLWIGPEVRSLTDVELWTTTKDFELEGYEHHSHIKYEFAV